MKMVNELKGKAYYSLVTFHILMRHTVFDNCVVLNEGKQIFK